MAITAARVSVTTAATLLASTTAGSLFNSDAAVSVFVGPSNVTSATGFEIMPRTYFNFNVASDEDLYAITASGTVVVHTLGSGS